METLGSHEHHIDLDSALDFINTLDLDDGQLVEHFGGPADAASWFIEHGLVHPEACVDWSPEDLERIKAIRGALRNVVDAVVEHRNPDPGSVDLVNTTLEARRPLRLELDGTACHI